MQVQINDIFFALHALVLTAVTVTQCFIYEVAHFPSCEYSYSFLGFEKFISHLQRDGQRVSNTCRVILAALTLFGLISGVLYAARVVSALEVIELISYIKLAVTLVKYIPQAGLCAHFSH